jgi:putative PIN family toxin of toxin-antitoxin system
VKRLVLDTDVVVAGMRSPSGASAALLRAAREQHVTILASLPLALEYEEICTLYEHRNAAGLTAEEGRAFLDVVLAVVEPIEIYFLWRPQLHDPDDEMVLEVAINGRANAIVTFNLRDYGTVPERFGISVLRPAEALRRIRP